MERTGLKKFGIFQRLNKVRHNSKIIVNNAIRDISQHKVACKVTMVKDWCRQNSLNYYPLKSVTEWKVPAYNVFPWRNDTLVLGKTTFPEIYLAEIPEPTIFGGHIPILVKKNTLLYDEYGNPEKDLFSHELEGNFIKYNPKDPNTPVTVRVPWLKYRSCDAGILLAGRWSFNYYHWLIDFLSRFWIDRSTRLSWTDLSDKTLMGRVRRSRYNHLLQKELN